MKKVIKILVYYHNIPATILSFDDSIWNGCIYIKTFERGWGLGATIGETMMKFSGSRTMRVSAIGIFLRNLPNNKSNTIQSCLLNKTTPQYFFDHIFEILLYLFCWFYSSAPNISLSLKIFSYIKWYENFVQCFTQ